MDEEQTVTLEQILIMLGRTMWELKENVAKLNESVEALTEELRK